MSPPRLPRLLAALLLAALAFLAFPAAAHETTRSYLSLEREGAEVAARLRLAFRDIEVVAWMDEDLDGRITWGEAKARLDAARSYAASRVRIDAGGDCPLRPEGAGVSQSGGIDYLDLTFTATCPDEAEPLQVASTLFADIDPGHRLFLTTSDGEFQTSAVIGEADALTPLTREGGGGTAFASFFRSGVGHFLAGTDHIVFLMVLILPAVAATGALRGRILGVVAAVTGFTIAHALTLTAAATDLLRPPSALIESLIALSIVVTAVDNIRPFIPGPRAALAAFFGTIHGFGFATALSALLLDSGGFAVAILGFNLGIEAAQVGVVILVVPVLILLSSAISRTTGRAGWGGRLLVVLGSAAAIVIASVWLWQRLPGVAALA
jgi:hypothetical protein